MKEVQVSEWTPAAYWAREEGRRQSIIEIEAKQNFQEVLQSEWTLSAFGAREIARRHKQKLIAPISSEVSCSYDARACSAPSDEILGSDWTLPAFKTREIDRLARERREVAANYPWPAPLPAEIMLRAQPILFSDWTLPAFHARECQRQARNSENAESGEGTRSGSSLTVGSEWTLPAVKKREIERVRQERLSLAAVLTPATTAALHSLAAPTRESKVLSQPILLSDWILPAFQEREAERAARDEARATPFEDNRTLSGPIIHSDWTLAAFQARELERVRHEARETAARAPVLPAAMRPFQRAAAMQAAVRATPPHRSTLANVSAEKVASEVATPIEPAPVRSPPRESLRPTTGAGETQKATTTAPNSHAVFQPILTALPVSDDAAFNSPEPRQTPAVALPSDWRPPRAKGMSQGVEPNRSAEELESQSAMLRRLGLVLGSGLLFALGIFFLRTHFGDKEPFSPPEETATSSPSAQIDQGAAQQNVTRSVEAGPSTPLPSAAEPSSPVAQPTQPANVPNPIETNPSSAAPSSIEHSMGEGPVNAVEPSAAPAPVVAPTAPLAPAAPSQNMKPRSKAPQTHHGSVPKKTPKPKHPEIKADGANSGGQPEPQVEQKQPESWFERLTSPLRR